MKVLIINTDYKIGGSVGRIAYESAIKFKEEGNEVAYAYGRDFQIGDKNIKTYKIGNLLEIYAHGLYTRLTDKCGFASRTGTKKFIQWANRFNPDLVCLHNIHGYYINIEALFLWIKSRPEMKVKWTLHDCWAFTGHCTYFSFIKCEKWLSQCDDCPQKREYPKSVVDSSKSNYLKKKELFTGVKKMEIIVPSCWLANLVKESFLSEYPVTVIHNRIDTEIFKPTLSTFREEMSLENSVIVLGVANVWQERKGLFDFYQLAKMLDDRFAIVLVGLSKKQIREMPKKITGLKKVRKSKSIFNACEYTEFFVDSINFRLLKHKKQNIDDIKRKNDIKQSKKVLVGGMVVPQNIECVYKELTGMDFVSSCGGAKIIAISRTNSAKDLAKLYSCADYFINPTYEDNYPTVNLEARSCGCKVITYDTGGAPETLGEL